ncbi:hypothetical protein OAR13_02040 [Gammaproteobacteria bacterium]|nr:hypothetical protein [Gammaproteobacteria bacterium]
MSQHHIDQYLLHVKEYKKIQKNIYRYHLSLMDMNRQPDLNLFDEHGLVQLEFYRIEKEWNNLKKRVKQNLVSLYKEKKLLDDWFRAFAELLDLKNETYNPMGYY